MLCVGRHGLFGHVQSMLVLCLGWLPFLWYFSVHCAAALGMADNEIVASLIFLTCNTLFDTVLDLPWTFYYTFVVEERHGFNRQVWVYVRACVRVCV